MARDNILQDGLLANMVNAMLGVGDVDHQLAPAASQLSFFLTPTDPDPTLGLAQFGEVTAHLDPGDGTINWNGLQNNADGELHFVALTGFTTGNPDATPTGEMQGWLYRWVTSSSETFWIAGFFEEPINLGQFESMTVNPAVVVPNMRGSGTVVR